MKTFLNCLLLSACCLSVLEHGEVFAEKYLGPGKNKTSNPAAGNTGTTGLAAGCAAPTAANFMDLNNVKALIFTGGDMFWDIFGTQDARYEVPKGSDKHSMFLASLWLGGTDLSGQLRIAAQRYASGGTRDFWTGPLSTIDAEVTPDVCKDWDKHFIITRAEVNTHNAAYLDPEEFPDYPNNIPKSILDWPAHGDVAKGQAYYLAPFFDQNGDGFYDPTGGDYPYYDLSADVFCDRGRDRVPKLFGDKTFWYVFNDKGNTHTETNGTAIGLEVHAQEFAFSTNDEINNMTFTNYIIINRSTFSLVNTYFGTNFDADLGCYTDDYVGCDVQRGLGYTYNGDAFDEDCAGNKGYGSPTPAVGVDFFEGPFMDTRPGDSAAFDRPAGGCDASINGLNFGDGIADNERWGMRRFVYYCNPSVGICPGWGGDPETAVHYYNYLRGVWKDNTRMQYGGNGHTSGCTSCEFADFMFPGAQNFPQETDPDYWGVCSDPFPVLTDMGVGIGCCLTPGIITPTWTEKNAGNIPNDRRFVHSAGPFTLEPGATNDITVGIVWALSNSSDPFESVELVRLADDKAQALFDNCFKLLNGPDAPVLSCQELDKEILLYISNPVSSNNNLEQYFERDPTLIPCDSPAGAFDQFYRFQGYQVYQLKDATVSVADIGDINMARLVAQVDIKDGIAKLVNFIFDEEIGYEIPTLMVNGEDKGIRHSFKVTKDLFASEDPQLVNHKTYYFMALAYAYNQFNCFSTDPANPIQGGNKKPYLSGRKDGFGRSIEATACIPHKPEVENSGTELNSQYGDSPLLTRIEGQGNGRLFLDLTQSSVDEIVKNNTMANPVYQRAKSPVNVKIIDPLNVPSGNFAVYFSGVTDSSEWMLVKETDNPLSKNLRWKPDFIDFKDTSSVLSASVGDRYIISDNNMYEWDGSKWIAALPTIPFSGYAAWKKGNKLLYVYDGSSWSLLEDAWHSEQTLKVPSEQIFPDLGISVTVEQLIDTSGDLVYPGPKLNITKIPLPPCYPTSTIMSVVAESPDPNNGFLGASMTFTDNNKQWLTGVPDGNSPDAYNWIRSGTFCDPSLPNYTDNGIIMNCASNPPNIQPWDPDNAYENILGGTWAPYALVSKDTFGAGPLNYPYHNKISLRNIMGVDLVITADRSKWTRSVVLETQSEPLFSEGGVTSLAVRSHASVDKDGNSGGGSTTDPNSSNYIDSTGMGWFPGYAVNVETGERLNIIFGENSFLVNGSDMLWNPTDLTSSPLGQLCIDFPEFCSASLGYGYPFWAGGMHFIYIVGNDIDGSGCGDAYDGGAFIRQTLDTLDNIEKFKVFKNILWTTMPLLKRGYALVNPGATDSTEKDITILSDETDMSWDVTVKLRVSRPYEKYGTGTVIYNPGPLVIGETYYVNNNREYGSIKHNGIQYDEGDVFVAVNDSFSITNGTAPVSVISTVNAANPLYKFSLDEFATRKGVSSIAEKALELINVVPNPYNGFSSYERSQLDNRIKIINLPQKCTVSIYNVGGTLIRRFQRDDPTITSIDWDLKNSSNVPIAGGVYLIHVNAPGIGERVIKWFGALRPVDLDAF